MVRTRQGTKRKAEADADANSSNPPTDSPSKQKLPVRAKDDEPLESKAPVKSVQGTLKVFGDDDEDEVAPILSQPSDKTAAAPPQEEGDEESDDDEAPEAVSTSKAASSIKKSAQEAQKAAQEEAAAQKRKRQERDTLFKQQAEERRKAAPKDAKEGAAAPKKRVHGKTIPDLLPEEFLSDSSSEDEDEVEGGNKAVKRPKRRKVSTVERNLTRFDQGPRDEIVGSTVYRVAKKTDQRLAPKLQKHSRHTKALLMQRKRPAVKPRAGFLKR